MTGVAESATGSATELRQAELHASLGHPLAESMDFLNGVALRYPGAISFAAGRPTERFLDLDDVHRHLDLFHRHLVESYGGDQARANQQLLQYGRTKGIIHDLVARNLAADEDIHVDPESIVVTVGCQEALFLCLRALRRTPDDVLLAVRPCYVGALGAAQLADMAVLPVAASGSGIDFADLEARLAAASAAGQRVRAFYLVADFANPTGTSLDTAARTRLLELAARHDFLLLEDNPYGLFPADDAPRPPTLKSLDRDHRVVYLGSYGKTGLPGARVGFAVADQPVRTPDGRAELLADQLGRLKSMLTVNTSPLAQAAIGGKLLANGFSLRAANDREREVYRGNLRRTLAGLTERFPPGGGHGVSWNTPGGGFFLVLRVPFATDDALLELSARSFRVLWTPMHHFYGDGVPVAELRLSVSNLTHEEIDTGLDRLAAFIQSQTP
ncbi:PLP-dependent aminotransferase family protein [Actinokineospora auranticolor]|uniref:(S)-3,5-dihydroxyphenylglycine transaminase n=1 Tax=Actinokineospora auranticolor TaxID=155976 RepID=A0A2S6GMR7_9PSEU|nr:PLP-dependent aminotransferase family protein [Actinokineospora auranticolor]PPK66532.1 (S)-3,5-dihydroxyphenylglycine transaminase [Actinokineospora auranticolor]